MNPIARKLFSTLLILIAFVFFLGSAVHSVVAQAASSTAEKCPVCHNGRTTILIPCDKVANYLQNHPGDTAGECQSISKEKP